MATTTSGHYLPDVVPLSASSISLDNSIESCPSRTTIARDGVVPEISKRVVRQKLNKLRHLVIEQAISPRYLDGLFPDMLEDFDPQHVVYNGGIAKVKEWKISCYLEVMERGVPCTNPNTALLRLFEPILDTCNDLFLEWYRQQHACNNSLFAGKTINRTCKRLMTFITRYTPAPGEQALLKVSSTNRVPQICSSICTSF